MKRFGLKDGKSKIYQGIFCAAIVISMLLIPMARFNSALAAKVPYMVCPDDSSGPPVLQSNGLIEVGIPEAAAAKLAFYAGGFVGALAPRNWECIESDEDDYSSLSIYPHAVFENQSGPLVEASEISSDAGGGRFDVAEYVCRYFAKTSYNYENMCRDGRLNASGKESGPEFSTDILNPVPRFLNDKVNYVNPDMLEFETGIKSRGLGTSELLDPTSHADTGPRVSPHSPTRGLIVANDWGLKMFKVRLSENADGLAPIIVRFEKQCYLAGSASICQASDAAHAH